MTELRRPPYPLEEPDASLGELVGRLSHDVGEMFRDHIELAKEETKAELKEASVGAGLMGGAALAGWMTALMLTIAAAWGLAEIFGSIWLGFLAIGLIWAVVAGVLWFSGRKEMAKVDLTPRITMNELEEDKRWLREQTN